MIHCVDYVPYILYCLPYIFTHEMTPNEYLTRDNIIVPRVKRRIAINYAEIIYSDITSDSIFDNKASL